jgi:hypothetical protein
LVDFQVFRLFHESLHFVEKRRNPLLIGEFPAKVDPNFEARVVVCVCVVFVECEFVDYGGEQSEPQQQTERRSADQIDHKLNELLV